MLFLPLSNGIYTPLILKQINKNVVFENNEIKSYKNNYFLDFDTIDK